MGYTQFTPGLLIRKRCPRIRDLTFLAFQTVTEGDGFQFDPDGVRDWNYGTCFEYECGQHRTKLVNRSRIIAIQHHVTAPVTHSDHE